MKGKWYVIGLVLAIVMVTVTAGAALAAEYNWKIGHIRPTGTDIDKDVNWLVNQIEEKSDGDFAIEVYPAGQLGDYTVVQERVSMGAVEMQLACLGTTVSKALNLPAAPYIATNYEEAEQLFGPEGEVYKIVEEVLRENENIHLISGWPCYYGGIGLMTSVPSPGDPTVPKKVKIRVPPIKSFELTAESLGYLATPIPWAEAFTALQTNIVEGVIGGGAEGYYANFRDLLTEYHAVNDHFEMWWWYMNKDLWESLSEEDQKLLTEMGRKLEEKRWGEAEAAEEENMDKLADEGIKIVTFNQDQLNAMAERVREEVWPEIEKDIGKEYFDRVKKAIGYEH
ncbi:MAG: TRAP transporter substrate-binding protein DctP [Synergistales bacterium]|nr:TRAP transporter substrate-binding protein DctP [Synergistales bacterium]